MLRPRVERIQPIEIMVYIALYTGDLNKLVGTNEIGEYNGIACGIQSQNPHQTQVRKSWSTCKFSSLLGSHQELNRTYSS